ncbi:flagellar export protein FliJ [Micromonospora sp. C95]|uniref:flagellar export protein FliJ n=1 Tax=Micromonospora sp. C95 TaxID=2824882 RepID=UPI001B37FCCE|nr:flagellar export protein FliJ [Micromonospora sp. C95]MBQ1025983.1 hypothetical protein [Micromonospora sp. C95]
MREPGIGRSGGLTEWHLMNVADMWACLQGHHTDNHWRHVAGWRKIAELAGQHLGRLRTYRESLAQAWPPETNAASHAYLAKLDELIEQVQRTHDTAATNQTALSAATQALSSSRDKIEKIHQEYADKLQQKRSWEQTAADPKAAAASRAIQPPVTDSDLEQLNIQARNVMYGLSTELHQAQTQLRHPPPTKPTVLDGAHPDAYSGIAAPLIPPVVALPPSLRRAAVRKHSTTMNLGRNSAIPTTGPVLGRADPSPTTATPSTPSPNAPASASSANPPLTPEFVIRPSNSRPVPEARKIGKEPDPMPHRNPPNTALPDGIIGGVNGGSVSHSGASNTQLRSSNPSGGVIGGGAAGTAPTGGAGSRPAGRGGLTANQIPVGGSPMLGPTSGRGISRTGSLLSHPRDGNETRRWDPDNPWAVNEGLSPIIRPPDEEGPIDPGPAIGLTR